MARHKRFETGGTQTKPGRAAQPWFGGKPNRQTLESKIQQERSAYDSDIVARFVPAGLGRMGTGASPVPADRVQSNRSDRFRPNHRRRLLAAFGGELYVNRQQRNDLPTAGGRL